MMTPYELWKEQEYRREERLGILCEDRPPTFAQLAIARAEAEAWRKKYEQEHEKSST